jgi:hypothetical protein
MTGPDSFRFLTALTLAAALAHSDRAAARNEAPTLPAGWYDATRVSGETGDEDGLRLKLKYVVGKPQITFWWCEGECLARTTHNLSIDGNKITFIADDESMGPQGMSVRARRFTGTFRNGRLALGSPGFWPTQRLRWAPFKGRDD